MRALAGRAVPQISAQAISQYEAGRMMPSSAVLLGLAKALDVSLDFLMSAQVEAIDDLEFRRQPGGAARDRARAEATLIDSLDRYLTIEDILGVPPARGRFVRQRNEGVITEEEIEDRAEDLREAWFLGQEPVTSLSALLEEKGIRVIEADLPERINGLTCHALRDGEPVAEAILVSSRTNVERRRFTLAHELGHRMLPSTDEAAMGREAAMNRFAAAFLVPRRRLMAEAGGSRRRVTYWEIVRLKHKYGVSAAAMLRRLGEAGVLKAAAVRRAFRTFARTWCRTEPEPITGSEGFAAFEKPQRFRRLVWQAVGEELISPVRAAGLLGESLHDIERQIAGPAIR